MSDALLVFDLGGTNLRAGAFAPKTGQLLNTARTSSDEVRGVADGAAALEAVLADLGGQVLNRQPAAVGMAVPGPVQDGVASRLPSLFGPAYKGGLDFEALGRRLWDRPTFACNDLTAAGHGLVAAGHRDFGVLTLGSGVGGKLFVGGRPLLGRAGFGGEIGHWRVPGAPPVACDCGGVGHLSALASGRGVVRLARWRAEKDPRGFKASALAEEVLDAPAITAAFHAGDRWTGDLMAASAEALGAAIAVCGLAAGLETFFLTGGFAVGAGEPYRRMVAHGAAAHAWATGQDWDAGLKLAAPGEEPGLTGAGWYALERMNRTA